MEIDNAIMEYLHEYGNTKESDLIDYFAREFEYSERQLKKIIERMEKEGSIYRVVHEKLKPPGVYISLSPKAQLQLGPSQDLPITWKVIDQTLAKEFEKILNRDAGEEKD